MDMISLIVAGAAALAVLLLVVGMTSSLGGAAINARLERYLPGRDGDDAAAAVRRVSLNERINTSRTLEALNKTVEGQTFGATLARDIARADLRLRVSEYLLLWAISIAAVPATFLAASVIFPTLRGPLAMLAAVAIGFALPPLILRTRTRRRLNAFNAQLADTIMLLGNALRSGSSFMQAAERVVREAEPPISIEFGRMLRELQLGLPMEQALQNMVRRVRSDDLELMASAIELNRQFGGNLAEILDQIAFTIRERIRIKGEIAALTAQQKLSGYVVALLPIGLAVFLFAFTPTFMAPMFEQPPSFLGLPAGFVLIGIGAIMMTTGILIIRQIVDIDV